MLDFMDENVYNKRVKKNRGLSIMENNREILFFEPCLKDVVWGGSRLRDEFGYKGAGDSTGECWGISAHPHGDCKILQGPYKGMTLSGLYNSHRELFGNIEQEEFPLLVKILDAREDLSVQVHPDDAYARAHENGARGKNECWYIMDCPADASLVIGHHATSRKELADMIHAGKYRELIRQIPVQKGDFLQIAPGTVHVIKSGFTILETQQSSDITYRVYDYDRLVNGSKRPLHVQESIDVITVPDNAERALLSHTVGLPDNSMNLLIDCPCYKVFKLTVNGTAEVEQKYPFLLASVLEGKGSVNGEPVCKGAHFMLPAGFGMAAFAGNMELILSTV